MDIFLLNTSHGLIPLYDEDYEEKRRLRIGETYKAKIVVPRNLKMHRKYFALLNCSWALMSEAQREFFSQSKDAFRETVQIAAGHFKEYYNIEHNEWRQEAKSISFDKMPEDEFRELYSKVFDVILHTFLKKITPEVFNEYLINF